MSKALDELRDALYGTTLVQPVSHEGRGGNLGILCRQVPGQEKAWIRTIDTILALTQSSEAKFHLCRRYVRKPSKDGQDGGMVFGWFFGIEAKSAAGLVTAVQELIPILARGPSIAQEVAAEEKAKVPVQPKKYVSQYADRTHQSAKEGLEQEGLPAERAAPQREGREFEIGPDPVTPRNFRPVLKVLAVGTDDKGKRTTIEEMQLPHVYKDNNVPNDKGKGAYGGGNTAFSAPKRAGS